MKRLSFSFVKGFVIFSLFLSSSVVSRGQTIYPNYSDGIIYLKLKDTCMLELSPYSFTNLNLNQVFTDYSINTTLIDKPFPNALLSLSLSKVYRISFPTYGDVDSLITDLENINIVDYAEKIPLISVTYIPNDVSPLQYHLTKINAIQAWDITQGSPIVVIAIVDNAVRITHSDLYANIWVNPGETPGNFLDDDLNGYTDDINGYDVADGDNNPNPPLTIDDSSPFVHGTHTSGISSSVTDNNNGIASLGFNTKIMAVKCTPDAQTGNVLTNAYDGVYYAIQSDANVISMSWGGTGSSLTDQSMMNLANSLGIVLVAAAGNDDTNEFHYPAAYNNVIGVGSTDQNDIKSGFSNYGNYIDVMAPGSGIYSTLGGTDNSYGSLNGTSMATPLVAALAALVISQHSSYTPAEVEQAIENGCDNIDLVNPSYIGQIGAGRINAFKTLSLVGIENMLNQTNIVHIYPNPANEKITVSFNKEILDINGDISIYNMKGELVFLQKSMFNNNFIIDIGALVPGEYIIKGIFGKSYFVKTLVII